VGIKSVHRKNEVFAGASEMRTFSTLYFVHRIVAPNCRNVRGKPCEFNKAVRPVLHTFVQGLSSRRVAVVSPKTLGGFGEIGDGGGLDPR
jgi:hypothetical protein